MSDAGEYAFDGFPIETAERYGGQNSPRTLAIVGSHPKGLVGVPWEDPSVEVLLSTRRR